MVQTNDFINKLRQRVDSRATDIINNIKSLGYVLNYNPNDFTIYSFKNINDGANIIINIMVITAEQEDFKEANNLFYNASSSSLIKTDYYIMDKGVQRICITYDGFINMSPADAIIELQDINKYITDLAVETIKSI